MHTYNKLKYQKSMIAILATVLIILGGVLAYVGYNYRMLNQEQTALNIKYEATKSFADECAKRILSVERSLDSVKDSTTAPYNSKKPKRNFKKSWKPQAADKK